MKINKMEIDLTTTIEALKDNGFDFIETYSNGITTYYGFDKERKIEVTIKINENPDDEDIENFEELI
jgi:hypothetical protein